MAKIKPFSPVKLICGIIASNEKVFNAAEDRLIKLYGVIDNKSSFFPFNYTDYYEKQMGKNLKRRFISFEQLMSPERLSEIKICTNTLEEEIKKEFHAEQRIVNIDPGYLTASALIMATTKDFAHRIPLEHGIYAHLELVFGRKQVRALSWTYPDYKAEDYHQFFLEARRIYLVQLKHIEKSLL